MSDVDTSPENPESGSEGRTALAPDSSDSSAMVSPQSSGEQASTSILDLNRLNGMLSRLAGKEFRIVVYTGDSVRHMDDRVLDAMAECYADLAREKWNEKWTAETARETLKNAFGSHAERTDIVSLVFKGDQIIGLCWAFLFSPKNPGDLAANFASAKLNNADNQQATREWLEQVGGEENLVTIRELGVLGQYRKIRPQLLCAPVFSSALEFGSQYIFLRTPVNSEALKQSQGIGFVPVHYYVVNQMLLMLGSLEQTLKEYEFRILEFFADQLSTILDQGRDFDAVIQQTEMDYSERMRVMESLSANIAHEMRTPLAGVRASMNGLENYLPVLLDVYRKQARTNPEGTPAIRGDHLGALGKTPERITLMIDQANSVIDMLLMNLRDNTVDKSQFRNLSAADCVKQAMERYPFKRGEEEKISLALSKDFYFRGLDSLFVYVIFNLMKNALYSIHSALKGEVSITLKPGKGFNTLVFRDTGEGMSPSVAERIFDGFYSTREEGTGVGLAFCKRAIHSFDGEITCRTESGEFAEFIITLPAT